MSYTYNLVSLAVAIVATGYRSSILEFKNAFKRLGIGASYGLSETDFKIEIDENIPNREQIIKNARATLPILRYSTLDESIVLDLLLNEAKISVQSGRYDISSDNDKFKKLTRSLLDLKTSDIETIGVNFLAHYKVVGDKIKLLNEKIEKIPCWKNNITFILTIPIKYPEYVATYKIQKLFNPSIGDDEERMYQFDVNFSIDLLGLNSGEKYNKINEILTTLESKYYNEFEEKCEELLQLNLN